MDQVYTEKQRWKLDKNFEHVKDFCYLDNAGAALYSTRQITSNFQNLSTNLYGNPHSLNESSRKSNEIIEQIRIRLLNFFHTDETTYSIIFTSGATSAIKLLIENFTFNVNSSLANLANDSGETLYNAIDKKGSFVFTASNHTSVVGGREIAHDKGANVLCLPDESAERLFKNFSKTSGRSKDASCNSLFAYPAQCNFSGRKFPLDWSELTKNGALNSWPEIKFQHSTWFTLLDAATYCSTNPLDLSRTMPDFVCVSFYKIFGYPTGLGALIVRNDSGCVLNKKYFGGGTVDFALPSRRVHSLRNRLHERFEDGTLPYLSILALAHGLDNFKYLGLTMQQISLHVFKLSQYTAQQMKNIRHWNGLPLVEIYTDTDFSNVYTQGGIVTFNLKRSDGTFIGYAEVLHVANLYKIQLRTGCFCNIGACQLHLKITDNELKRNFKAGHICGDARDLVAGKPTGAVRVSFGYSSSLRHADCLLRFLSENFAEKKPQCVIIDDQLDLTEKIIRLKNICLFPVKSCGAMEVSSWSLTERGLHLDRQWMVVTENGTCLTQKVQPLMCRIIPSVDQVTEVLTISFDGLDSIKVQPYDCPSGNEYSVCSSKVCGDKVMGDDCGDLVASWLSYHLMLDGLRLVRQQRNDGRSNKIKEFRGASNEPTGQLSLANQAQYLVINRRSVDWLRQRIETEPDFNLDTLEDRFRANFIVDGGKEFDELKWKIIQIGKTKFQVEGPCTRCQMICIDQKTGEKNRKPLVTLSRALEGKLRFGIYCSHLDLEEMSMVSVGDDIIVKTTE